MEDLIVYEVYYYGWQFLRVQILQKGPKLVSEMYVLLIFMYSGSDPCIPLFVLVLGEKIRWHSQE